MDFIEFVKSIPNLEELDVKLKEYSRNHRPPEWFFVVSELLSIKKLSESEDKETPKKVDPDEYLFEGENTDSYSFIKDRMIEMLTWDIEAKLAEHPGDDLEEQILNLLEEVNESLNY